MSQKAKLLNYLESHDGITTLEATDRLRICRLSERIRELESLGYRISHTPEHTENARVIRYRLTGESCKLPASRSETGHVIGAKPTAQVMGHSNAVSSPPYKSWMR